MGISIVKSVRNTSLKQIHALMIIIRTQYFYVKVPTKSWIEKKAKFKFKDSGLLLICYSQSVWPEKSCQMSIKVAQNDFIREMIDFDTFTKIA